MTIVVNGEPIAEQLVAKQRWRFYGVASAGGEYQSGTVYRYNNGALPPLPTVQYFRPQSGSVDAPVLIRGSHLIGLVCIGFNGIPATKIISRGSDYAITYVPTGARSGPITITTSNGSGSSGVSFEVSQ